MRVPGRDSLRTRPSLLARLKDWNDDASWEEFNDLYRGLIYRFALAQGAGEEEAEDMVQETMSSVATALKKGQYDPQKGSFKSWLHGITRNRVADYFRRHPRWREASRVSRADTTRTPTVERVPDPRSLSQEAIWEEQWRNNVMDLALEKLRARVKPKHFQIFYLHVIKQQPTGKVAKTLGVSKGLVYLVKYRLKGTMKRSVRKLQRELEARPERTAWQ